MEKRRMVCSCFLFSEQDAGCSKNTSQAECKPMSAVSAGSAAHMGRLLHLLDKAALLTAQMGMCYTSVEQVVTSHVQPVLPSM